MVELNSKVQLNEHQKEFEELIERMVEVKRDASKRYGVKIWNSLGSKGLFVDINRKFMRLKHYVWEDNREATSECIEDTLLDLSIYALLMIMSLKREGLNRETESLRGEEA